MAAIHRAIFEGVFKHAGRFRDYDISKKEWVLQWESVLYGRWQDLRMTIEYDLEQERQFDYKGLDRVQIIEHLASFVAGLWQIHPFGEGNTRTTAVFTIKYLRYLGFSVNNDLFECNSWYFRNALVRANYRNVVKGVEREPIFLIRFFRNLLLHEQWDLRNRYLHIHPTAEWKEQPKLGTRTSSEQAPEQVPEQAAGLLHTDNPLIIGLVKVIGDEEQSITEIMKTLGLRHRPNFLEYHLNPAIKDGFVRMKYPDSPRHPRQKYLLTVKGLALYNEIK